MAVLTPVFWPYSGGIGRVVANEAMGLKAEGHGVDIFTPRYKTAWQRAEQWQGVNIRRLKPGWKIGNAAGIKVESIDLEKYDLIHLHYPFIGGVKSVLKWKKKTRKPLVVTYHMDLVADGWRGILFKIYSWIVLPKIVAAADKIIFSSLDYGQHSFLAEYFKKQPAKFTAIPFGVEIKDSRASNKIEAKKELGLNSIGKVVLFVGALDKAHYFKGLDVLFAALYELRQFKEDFKVVIIGDGGLKDYYQKKARQMWVFDKIKFVGKVNEEDLQKYYQAGDVLVLPSIGPSEAYGMVLIEAQTQGLPVIASNLPGVREQVGEDRGRLFKIKDSKDLAKQISVILKDKDLAEKMGEAAKNWANKNRSIKQEVESLLAVYKSMLQR
ncbi:MAG: glycosyltransferase family 4 protein [Candidatus Magasanikbacteria bacterium]|nr:glycosyltransferase family 4 protein [Candidatus Magasanikbacteria bacterium]